MPKFGSEKKFNTDAARESEAKPRVEKPSVESSKTKVQSGADKNVGVTRVEKTQVATAREARGGGRVSQWGLKLRSLVSQKPKATRSAIPPFNGVPVQGELSLDKIKVVRNDLSDTDLEVVARKVAPTVTPKILSADLAGLSDKNAGVTAPEKLGRQPAMVEVES